MKQKTLFQKGMKAAVLSLMLAVGVLIPGKAAENNNITVKVSLPDNSSLVQATAEDLGEDIAGLIEELGGMGDLTQTIAEGGTMKPVVCKVSSFVRPGASEFGNGGYYLPEDYAEDLQESLAENNDILLMPMNSKDSGGDPLVMIMSNLDDDDAFLPVKATGDIITISLPSASPQQSGSLKGCLTFGKTQKDDGTYYMTITNKDNMLTEKIEWKHIPADGGNSITGNNWSAWNPTSTLNTIVTSGTIQIKYENPSDCYPVPEVYEFEVENGEKKESKEKFTVTIQNSSETSHLQKAADSGELTQQVEVNTAIQPIVIEPISYKTPGSEASVAAGYYIEKDCLGNLQTYGLSAAYEDNKITITGTPTQNVTITLPNAPAQSTEARDASDQLCYVGGGVYAGTTAEMVYLPQNQTEWLTCSAGQTTVGTGMVQIKYKETAAYPTSAVFGVVVDHINNQKEIKIESAHGQVQLTYHGVATNYIEVGKNWNPQYQHSPLQQPQAEVTADEGYRCTGLVLYNSENTELQKIALTAGKGTLTYEGSVGTGSCKLVAVYEPISYSIQTVNAEHGSITVPESAGFETEVTITVEPDPGYMLAGITVKSADGKEVPVQDDKFTMPLGNVTITPVFKLTPEKENELAANAAISLIDSIGDVTYTDGSKALIDAARAAYNELTEAQKKLVSADKLAVLTNAEAAYESWKAQAEAAANQAAANAVVEKINVIGNVAYSDASKALIDAARTAYNALTEEQKALVAADKLVVLTNAETTYTTLTAAALAPKLEQKKAGKNSIAITWKEDKKATAGYRIYIKGGSYKKFTKVADTKKGVTSYTIQKVKNKKLAAGTQYEIKIVSLKKSGKKTAELSTQKLKAATVTAAPKITSAKRSKNGKQLTLKWKKVSGASGYELQMSTKAKTGFKKIAACKAKSTSYTKKGLTKSKTYYFRMRTYKTINGKKFYSSWSAVKKVSKVK